MAAPCDFIVIWKILVLWEDKCVYVSGIAHFGYLLIH